MHIFAKFRKFSLFTGGVCSSKNAPRRRLSAVQKPANLYSTKCRFFGPPPPPPGVPVHESALPRGFWGTPPKSPTQPQAPLHAPGAFHDVALADVMILNLIIIR